MFLTDAISVEQLKLRMDLYNLQHFLLTTPPGYKRDLFDAELRRLWARWDKCDDARTQKEAG